MFLIVAPTANNDLAEFFVARQQLIERAELAQGVPLERPAPVFVDKRLEPIAQRTRLCRNGIELTGNGVLPQSVQDVVRHHSSLPEPGEKVFPRDKPLDL